MKPVLPPQNANAEKAVLGAMLLDGQAILRVEPFLKSEHFYFQKHRWIYEALLALHKRREPLDYLTLVTELEGHKQLKKVGGGAYISQLLNYMPSAINVDSYGHIIENAALRRALLEASGEIARLAHDDTQEIEKVLGGAEAAVFQVRQGQATNGHLQPLSAVASGYYDDVTAPDPILLSTGYTPIDNAIGGWRKGALHIVAARPGIGKSVLLTDFAERVAHTNGKHVLFFTLEMSAEEVFGRILTAHSALSAVDLRAGRVPPLHMVRLIEGIGRLSEMPLWIDDTPGISIQAIRAKSLRMTAEVGIDLICVDYLQLCTTNSKLPQNRQQYVDDITRNLKLLARELRVPVVAAAQLNRRADDARPTLAMLRESGGIENHADMVTFLWPPRTAEPGQLQPLQFIIAKHRHGPLGTVPLAFNPQRVAIVPLSGQRE